MQVLQRGVSWHGSAFQRILCLLSRLKVSTTQSVVEAVAVRYCTSTPTRKRWPISISNKGKLPTLRKSCMSTVAL